MVLSHVVMHVALCNAAARLGPQAELPVRVVVTDSIRRDVVDQTARITRYEGNNSSLDFDIPWGSYRASIRMHVGKITCSGMQYFAVLLNHNRSLTVQLHRRMAFAPPPTIVMGTAPFAFSYVQPTVMVFGPGTKCNGAVGTPLNVRIDEVNDSDGYYASIYPTAALTPRAHYVVAVRMTDTQGGYHYVRVPSDFVGMSGSWPVLAQFNVTQNVIDWTAGKPEDTLLCPRLYKTETSG